MSLTSESHLSSPANPGPEAMDAPLDSIGIADRSRRCFVLGLIAAAPVLGLPAAVEAMRVFSATARETGEQWKHGRFIASFIAGWLFLAAIYPLAGFTVAFGFFLVELGLLGWLFVVRFRRTRARTANPSRRWLYGGLALAYAQAFILVPAMFWVLHFLQYGLKR